MANESILDTTKKLIGPDVDYGFFDMDLIVFINSSLSTLCQVGIGPSEGFVITDNKATWEDFIGTRKDIEDVKSYVYLKTRLVFDPPQMGYLVEAIKDQIKEIEWRLSIRPSSFEDFVKETEVATTDYNKLNNKPKINDVTLEGNKKLKDIGITEVSNEIISTLF